eukprot:gnl/TRDRNA2_/TRDRNA2_85584_c0_seq1.p1 gnl/TRDRNA2_/TRDRNA2_85584_c0~~gnl/TRDRNA2_/TRDRNA2_85584_c0_seq1.p1  ORF type:complete len:276 (+),score=16.24 gnl/TRDRNA2_/TRDRNA2_85584_c0_seq1:118-828(+)
MPNNGRYSERPQPQWGPTTGPVVPLPLSARLSGGGEMNAIFGQPHCCEDHAVHRNAARAHPHQSDLRWKATLRSRVPRMISEPGGILERTPCNWCGALDTRGTGSVWARPTGRGGTPGSRSDGFEPFRTLTLFAPPAGRLYDEESLAMSTPRVKTARGAASGASTPFGRKEGPSPAPWQNPVPSRGGERIDFVSSSEQRLDDQASVPTPRTHRWEERRAALFGRRRSPRSARYQAA